MKELVDLFRKKFEKKIKIIIYEGPPGTTAVPKERIIVQGKVKFFEEGLLGVFSRKDSFRFPVLRFGYFPYARIRIESKDGSILNDCLACTFTGLTLDSYCFSKGAKLIFDKGASISLPREWMI